MKPANGSWLFVLLLSGLACGPLPKDPACGDNCQDGDNGGGANNGGVLEGPVPTGKWKNVTANLANMDSECGNLSQLVVKPDADALIAGVALRGLWISQNGGQSWTALGTGAGSDAIINRPSSIVYDPESPKRFWESGLYNGSGVYRSDDNGKTFSALGDVTHSDLVSVDFTDPARKVLVASGHETPRSLFKSADGGASWINIGASLPGDLSCTWPLVLGRTTYLVGCSYTGEGIYRTTDGGKSWTRVSTVGGGAAPLLASDGSIYWAGAIAGSLVRSTDQGKTWKQVTGGGVVVPNVSPIELPDGSIAMVGDTVVLTADQGATWKPVSAELPYKDVSTLVYSDAQRAFFVRHFDCGDKVLPDAIMRYDYDYE